MSNINLIKANISGLAPGLLMHNPRSANPLDPQTKILNEAKKIYQKNKIDENLIPYLREQWNCALYWSEGTGCYIPRTMLMATMLGAAKNIKQVGKRWTLAKIISTAIAPRAFAVLSLDSPHSSKKDIGSLYEDLNFSFVTPVKIGNSLVTSSRPLFKNWSTDLLFKVTDATRIPMADFKEIVTLMGDAGFGDWRPSGPTPGEYGMFVLNSFETSENDGKTWKAA